MIINPSIPSPYPPVTLISCKRQSATTTKPKWTTNHSPQFFKSVKIPMYINTHTPHEFSNVTTPHRFCASHPGRVTGLPRLLLPPFCHLNNPAPRSAWDYSPIRPPADFNQSHCWHLSLPITHIAVVSGCWCIGAVPCRPFCEGHS